MKAFSVPLLLGLGLTAICAQCAVLRFPVPPQQHQPWHPDSAIPTNIVSAAKTLFEQGFPDPRGCEYRQIEVEVSDVWDGKARLMKTDGWVLPEERGTNHFAICWNGLIYPVMKAFGPADLRVEVSSNSPTMHRLDFDDPIGEVKTVKYANALSTRVLLLLRCGETTAAFENWSPNRRMMVIGFSPSGRAILNNDPYLEFARVWAWAIFDRAISAHQRGDEALALATAQELAEVQPKIEAECARRGFQSEMYYDNQHRGKKEPYLDFLDQLPQILADLERRVNEPQKTNVIEAGITNYPDQAKRIAALIDDLDLVHARQWSQPGGVMLSEDPIVSTLIQQGDPAVEPLLNCLESDKRLTRSVEFWRDFFYERSVIPVHDAAEEALQGILRAEFKNDSEIRAYWNKYKGLTIEDRWYAILEDNSAAGRWGEAAANIVQPENIQRFPGGFSISKPAPTNAPVRMNGEMLRAKSDPSVSELMARRALEVPSNDINDYDISASCQMALYLADWDSSAALPVARTLSKRACTVMKYSGQQLGPLVAKVALARAKAGDPKSFDDYVSWIVTTTPDSLDFSVSDCLEPFRQFATNRMLQAASEKMFGDTNSGWSQLPWNGMQGDNPIGSDLVNLPAFRSLLIRELGKTKVCGSFTWRMPGQIDYTIASLHQSGSYGAVSFPSGTQPANGANSELRWCDWVAFSLSQANRIPFFNPFAPVTERDAMIENARKLLGQP